MSKYAPPSREEFLIATLAGLLKGARRIAVGQASPIPGAAALLYRAESAEPVHIDILESPTSTLTGGSVELFDRAAQGRIDAFFLGGGQIDGAGNVNLVGIGEYPKMRVRWPGSFGAAYLYLMVPRVILFRAEHSPRVLVKKVDFISAPGLSDPAVHRPGGPYALLTGKALFRFDKAKGRFRLKSIHPGSTMSDIVDNTGFSFDADDALGETPAPDAKTLALIRGPVAGEIQASYPQFARRVFQMAPPDA